MIFLALILLLCNHFSDPALAFFMLQIIMAKPAGGPKRDPAAGMDED